MLKLLQFLAFPLHLKALEEGGVARPSLAVDFLEVSSQMIDY